MTLTFHSFSTCSPYLVMLPPQATEKLQPPSTDHIAESQPPPALPQLSKSPGKSFLPAVPSASKMKPSLSFHAGMRSKKENSKLGLFCISAPPLKRLEGVTVWAVISCLLLSVSEFQVFLGSRPATVTGSLKRCIWGCAQFCCCPA